MDELRNAGPLSGRLRGGFSRGSGPEPWASWTGRDPDRNLGQLHWAAPPRGWAGAGGGGRACGPACEDATRVRRAPRPHVLSEGLEARSPRGRRSASPPDNSGPAADP